MFNYTDPTTFSTIWDYVVYSLLEDADSEVAHLNIYAAFLALGPIITIIFQIEIVVILKQKNLECGAE